MAFTPFHHSLIRPNLILGCDREMIMISGIAAFALIATALEWVAAFASVLLWTLASCSSGAWRKPILCCVSSISGTGLIRRTTRPVQRRSG